MMLIFLITLMLISSFATFCVFFVTLTKVKRRIEFEFLLRKLGNISLPGLDKAIIISKAIFLASGDLILLELSIIITPWRAEIFHGLN